MSRAATTDPDIQRACQLERCDDDLLTMDTDLDGSPVVLTARGGYHDIVDCEFLRLVFHERLLTVRGNSWITRAKSDQLPGEVLVSVSYFYAAQEEALIKLDGALVHVIFSERALTIRVAARDSATVERATDTLRQVLPEVHGEAQEVPVSLWWWQPHGAREMARMLPAPAWPDIARNYSEKTQPDVGRVMTWKGCPPAGGRLLLWHGDPGTGKTTAIRALAWEWRSWAEFQFVTDPEQFLENPTYLLQAISESRRHVSVAANRWKILVLEDAGEYLAPDAKHRAGQALSRLLNVCDGVLGQATRSLVLVTTNEPLQSLHSALSRPGRCLAEIEFAQLNRTEIEQWCEMREIEPPSASRSTLAELYAHAEGRVPTRRTSRGFGFADAA